MNIRWKAVDQYFTVELFIFHFYLVCNFGTFVNFGFERLNKSPRTNDRYKPFNFQHHTVNSPFLLPHITNNRGGDNFLIGQRNSCWMIISFILMTSLTERALNMQREI